MSKAAINSIPDETAWLCESCGYTLTGLPDTGNCPECGKPMRDSLPALRTPPLWERPQAGSALSRFIGTTAQIIFHPTHFYRSFTSRGSRAASGRFAQVHWMIVSTLLGTTGWIHVDWFQGMGQRMRIGASVPWYAVLLLIGATYASLILITRLAARLTHMEATYRGLRMPLDVVRRSLDYHAAHYLPVALVATATVVGFRWFLRSPSQLGVWGTTYLYTLCAEVVLAAGYLFKTYWAAMRNVMYASR